MTSKNKKLRRGFHGEAWFYEIDTDIPATAKPYTPKKENMVGDKLIIAKSETSGNHHVMTLPKGIELFEDRDGTLYIRNFGEPVQVSCSMPDLGKHPTITLPTGTFKKKIARVFNYEKEIMENTGD